ncbi:hypothetical protein DSO57_1004951 [Entomophthora muscae]|uniref:Uncharacterized protein n=1 Tax=Entomophthora muscae TaxID=34485 RepID=A0ACC2T7X1_9FUNG|nr:hypothetical protein DSO57_1004951 [Entomophthora muscae]
METSRHLTTDIEKTISVKTNFSTNSADPHLPEASHEEDIINVEELLSEFHWKAGKDAAALESSLLNELSNLETANIGAVLETDKKVEAILSQLELAINELDGIDSWLTLYKTELDSYGDDIFQIQSLNEGLQTQSQNQKALLSELEFVLGKVSVPDKVTDVLKESNFETKGGMEKILQAAASVQKCLKTNHEDVVRDMIVINEQMEVTITQSNNFSSRVFEYLKVMFNFQVDSALSVQGKGAKLRIDMKKVKEDLSKYRGLTLWLKEMDPSRHNELQQSYSAAIAKIYESEYKGLPDTFRSLAQIKKAAAEDLKYLLPQAASVKLAPTLHRRTVSEIAVEQKPPADSVLVQILNVIFPDIIKEQNFFCLMFHIGSTSTDFQGWVADLEQNQKPIKDAELLGLRKAHKDVKIRKRISENMERMFGSLSAELGTLGDVLVKYDWTLLIAFIAKAEAFADKCEQSNQEYLLKSLNSILNRFRLQLDKSIDELVKSLNEQEVSGKKRHGILPSFNTFPEFLARSESLVGNVKSNIRDQMDKAYQRIVNTMFENLEESVRQSEHDEKEQLNLIIISLENMHHFYTETGSYKKNAVMGGFNEQARASYKHNLQTYVKDVIRRPLGKLLEFFEGIEVLLQNSAPQEVGYHISYNKVALRKVMALFPPEEVYPFQTKLISRLKNPSVCFINE